MSAASDSDDSVRQAVERAIEALPADYAAPLRLRLGRGLDSDAIARELGISRDVAEARLRRGAALVRARVPLATAALLAFLAGSGGGAVLTFGSIAGAAGAVATQVAARWTIAKLVGGAAIAAAATWGAVRLASGDAAAPVVDPRIETAVIERTDTATPRRTPVDVSPAVVASRPDDDPPPVELPLYASLEGRFRDARGAEPGVGVALLRLHGDALIADWAPLPRAVAEPPFVVGAVETDAGGRFVFERVPPGGLWLLRVRPPGRPAFVDLIAARPPIDERVDLRMRELPASYRTAGRVIDPRGRPLTDAVVRGAPVDWDAPRELGDAGAALAEWNRAGGGPDRLVALPDLRGRRVIEPPAWLVALHRELESDPVEVDASGRFVWSSPYGPRDTLLVEAPGFAPLRLDVQLSRDGEELGEVVLRPRDEIEVVVVDPRGDPVVGAEVALGVAAGPAVPVVLERCGTTSEGGVLITGSTDGVPLIAAARSTAGEPWQVCRVAATGTRTIRLPVRHRVEVSVVGRTGVPLDDVELRLVPGAPGDGLGTIALHQLGAVGELPLAGHTEPVDTGTVAIDAVPEGAWILMVAASGRVPRAIGLWVDGPVTRRVELAETGSLRVDVFDAGFRALRGVAVAAVPPFRDDAVHALPVRLGSTGREAELVVARDPWSELSVVCADPGRGGVGAPVAAAARDQRLVVRGTGGVDGVLQSAQEGFEPQGWLVSAQARVAGLAEPPVLVAPQADGVVRIAGLAPGAWDVSARPAGAPLVGFGSVLALLWPPDREATHLRLDVLASSSTGFRLDPVPAPVPEQEVARSLRGRVLLDGAPSPRLGLWLSRGAAETPLALDEAGAFDAGEDVRGAVGLALRLGTLDGPVELWRAELDVGTAPEPLEIDLRTAAFGARLATAAGARADGVAVLLDGDAATDPRGRVALRFTTDGTGFVAFDEVPRGRYVLRVMDPAHGWLRREGFDFGPASVTTGMSIRLEPLLRIAGRVGAVGVEVTRLSEVELVRVDDDGFALTRVAVCAAGGTFAAEGLLPGRYRATLRIAVWVVGFGGAPVLIPPSASGIVVLLADVVVPERDVTGLTLSAR